MYIWIYYLVVHHVFSSPAAPLQNKPFWTEFFPFSPFVPPPLKDDVLNEFRVGPPALNVLRLHRRPNRTCCGSAGRGWSRTAAPYVLTVKILPHRRSPFICSLFISFDEWKRVFKCFIRLRRDVCCERIDREPCKAKSRRAEAAGFMLLRRLGVEKRERQPWSLLSLDK